MPARNLQAAALLHATPGNPKLLASLRTVLRNVVELQENISESRQRLADSDTILSNAGHLRKENRLGSVPREVAPAAEEHRDLRQPISAIMGRNPAPPPPRAPLVHDRLGHHPDLRDHLRAHEKER